MIQVDGAIIHSSYKGKKNILHSSDRLKRIQLICIKSWIIPSLDTYIPVFYACLGTCDSVLIYFVVSLLSVMGKSRGLLPSRTLGKNSLVSSWKFLGQACVSWAKLQPFSLGMVGRDHCKKKMTTSWLGMEFKVDNACAQGMKGRRDLPGKTLKQEMGQQGKWDWSLNAAGPHPWCEAPRWCFFQILFYVSKATARWALVTDLLPHVRCVIKIRWPWTVNSLLKIYGIDIGLVECGEIVSFQFQLDHCSGFSFLILYSKKIPRKTYIH